MEFRNRTPVDEYVDRAMFYRYVLADSSLSARLVDPHQRNSHYPLGAGITKVLQDTDPWGTSSLPPYYQDLGESSASDLGRLIRTPWAPIPRSPPAPYFGTDPLESFLAAKGEFLRESALDILASIHERESLHREHMQRMDDESCSIGSRLAQLDNMGTNPGMDPGRDSLDSQLQALERERRMQEVATWRDTTRLRADLRDMLGELGSEARKWAFLKSEGSSYG